VEEVVAEISSHSQVLDVGTASSDDSEKDNSSLPRRRIQDRRIYNGNYKAMAKQMVLLSSYALE
jgi:hypothetical protein